MALATSSVMISRNLSFSARTLANACTSRPVPMPSTKTASAAGGEAVRRSASCTQVAGGPGRQPDAPVLRVESATLIHKRHSSGKAHDAGCPCPSPCGPCGCPKGCGCLPPPCNLPPKCIQYMTGYYYYPYGTWFAGPYHVQGICQPVGKDSLSCDEGSGSPPGPPKDCREKSNNSILDYCKKIKKQCSPAKANCSQPSSPSCPPKPACPPPKPACPPPKTACPPPKPACPPAKPACPPSKPACPPSKAKSLEEICKSTKKPFPPNPPNPSKASCPPVAKSKSSRGIFGGKEAASSCPSTVLYQALPAKTDKAAKSIFEFYLKSPQKPSTAPDRS
ncbi:predicted GPI-anchored protein 58 isoform X1 [Aricia agestis]|uniref:predicted GPI-anchored protein 58 isoform X1 n=1 Tax=Aricia agestis TaxID=91739 RepID=UPI001C20BFFD|nr:predicted GPI-anchored protein 58 isoform X1 [Aricia agestis]